MRRFQGPGIEVYIYENSRALRARSFYPSYISSPSARTRSHACIYLPSNYFGVYCAFMFKDRSRGVAWHWFDEAVHVAEVNSGKKVNAKQTTLAPAK